MQEEILRQTSLPAHVVQFVRHLRSKGFELGISEEMDFLKAFGHSIPRSPDEQLDLYRALFVKSRRNQLKFDDLYRNYWKELERAEDSKTVETKEKNKTATKRSSPSNSLSALKDWLYSGRTSDSEEVSSYSAFEALGKKEFALFSTAEHKELRAIIRLMAQRMARKYNRRYVRSRRARTIDLRKTIHESLRKNGSIDEFFFRENKKAKVNVVLICDVSRSMELYSKFLIEFMYNFQQEVKNLHTYVFSTRLVSLSPILREQDFDKVLDELGDLVPHWAGGTRIGASLEEYRSKYGHRLNKDSIVFILSDGWDTGETDLLESAMAFIHKKAHRVIWLNPLASQEDYQPSTKGMKVCLPYIDVFTGVYNLDSLQAAVRHLRHEKKV